GSQAREGGLEVSAEGLLGAILLAADAVAPCAPRLIEQLDRHSEAGPDDAAVVDERLDRRGQHLKVLDGLARAGGLDEVAALAQPPVSAHGPVKDAGQLGEQPRGERWILAAVERVREHQHDQPPDQGAGGVGHLALLSRSPRATTIGNILRVFVRDNNVEQALRALKKKMQREGIFREMKRRKAYEKPSERKTREKAEASDARAKLPGNWRSAKA